MSISFDLDNFRLIYAGIATYMWIVSLVLSAEYMRHYERKTRYYLFTVITYLATVGVFLANDLYTMFIFFEIMSLASYVWVAFDEKKESLRAAQTYLAVSVIGGMVMLMGLFLMHDAVMQLAVADTSLSLKSLNTIYETARVMGIDGPAGEIFAGGICMLIGFGAKAGAFPIHIWLPKAHPVAPAPASALLSGILTKTGILGILMLSRYIFAYFYLWSELMLILGVCTMVLGALLALFSVNIKRTLACSSVSQIGFILTGIGASGIGADDLGLSGAMLHMVGHSLFKLILFCAAGVIFMNIHKLDLNSIRGFGRKKPLLMIIFASGALGISGIPLFNGYISKTLIHEGIVKLHSQLLAAEGMGMIQVISSDAVGVIEWIFLISGGCTFAYMLKLFICVFVEKNADPDLQAEYDEKKDYMGKPVAAVLTVTALIPPILGTLPYLTMNKIVEVSADFLNIDTGWEYVLEHYFTLECLKGSAISILSGAVIYVGIIRVCMMNDDKSEYIDLWPKWMDLENVLYRPIIQYALPFVGTVICRVLDDAVDVTVYKLRDTIFKDSKEQEELKEGNRITYALGVTAGKINRIRRRMLKAKGRKVGAPINFVHRFAMDYESYKVSRTVIFRSMSFGLMMFCLGLVAMVIYILITRWW